ncbi:MAG: GNAT family N-acetyltransferase [Acidimicrobiales bacterium]
MLEDDAAHDAPQQITVREATGRDAAGISEVNLLAWQSAYRGILPDTYLDGLGAEIGEAVARWRATLLVPDLPGRVTWVAEDNARRVIGYFVVGPCRDDDAVAEVGELWAIYVHPDEWRTGTGSILMEAAVEQLQAAGYDEAILWVFERNKRARAFYEHHGWRHDGASELFERGGGQAVEVRYRRAFLG